MTVPLELIARLQNEASPGIRQLVGDLNTLDGAAERASASISQQEAAQQQLDAALSKSRVSTEALAAAQMRLSAETDPEKLSRFVMAQRQLDIATERARIGTERLATAQSRLDAETKPEKQAQLRAAVDSAKVSLDQQTLSVDRLKERIIQMDKASDNAKNNTQSFGSQVTSVASQIAIAGAAITGAVVAIKEGFEFAQEGAQLEFVEQKFDNLAASINSSSGELLASLGEVTRGTLTTAEQMDLGSQLISLGLAKNEDGVTRLANVVTNLGLDMQQVIMTFANDSKMRLDALGLSITDVEERTKKYEQAGYDASEAFDLAVLDALEAKLALVGSAADTAAGSYDRLTTSFEESTNRLKEQVGMGLEPAVSATADYMTARNTLTAAVEAGILSQQESNALVLEFVFGTKTAAEVTAEYTDILQQQEQQANMTARKSEEMGASFEIVAEEVGYAAWVHYNEYIPAIIEARLQQQASINVHQETETTLRELANSERELTYTTNANMAAGQEAADVYMGQKVTVMDAAAAYQFLSSQMQAAQTPMSDLYQAQQDLKEAQGEWVETTRDTTGQVSELYQQLSYDLTDDQKKAMQEQLTTVTEGSEEWLQIYQGLQADLTDSQRQALVAQIADLQTAHGERLTVFTGDAEAAEEAQKRVDAAYAALAASYRAASLEISQAQIAQKFGEDALAAQLANIQMQEAMGTISGEEAAGLREVAENMDLVRRTTETMMATYLADGQLTVQESENIANAISLIESSGIESMDAIISMAENGRTSIDSMFETTTTATAAIVDMKEEAQEFADTPIEPEIIVETEPALANLNELALAAEAAAGTYEVHYNVTSDPIPDFPGGSQGGGGRDPGNTPKFGTGGYTGAGADDEIAGTVHRNEYVFDAAATRRLGVPYLESLRRGNSVREETAVSAPAQTPAPVAGNSVVIQIMGGDLAQVQMVVRKELERAGITAANYQRMK